MSYSIALLVSLQTTCNMCFTLKASKGLVHQQFIGRKAKATLHYSPLRTHTHTYNLSLNKWHAIHRLGLIQFQRVLKRKSFPALNITNECF